MTSHHTYAIATFNRTSREARQPGKTLHQRACGALRFGSTPQRASVIPPALTRELCGGATGLLLTCGMHVMHADLTRFRNVDRYKEPRASNWD